MDATRFEFIASLLKKHLNGEMTDAEKTAWNQWLAESPDNQELVNRLQDSTRLRQDLKLFYESKENIFLKIGSKIPELKSDSSSESKSSVIQIFIQRRQLLKYAAAVLLIAGLGGLFWFNHQSAVTQRDQVAAAQKIIQPGTNKAILTLGNGSKIQLDSTHQGIIAHDDGTAISVQDNQVSYQSGSSSGSITYNTMTTPRGGQYKLLLPDGSVVWLNAQSSITYPVRFSENERKVSITGEVYFEVVKDAGRPFIVDVNSRANIQVVGTHFNVNAYDDETSIHATLLEGSILIRNEKNSQLLKPGQQAQQDNVSPIRVVDMKDNDLNEVMAWKNGGFYFMDADINTLMRQLARWYDFDVSYAGEVKEKFHLEMTRNTKVENVFKILEATRGVHFKIEGKKITVMP